MSLASLGVITVILIILTVCGIHEFYLSDYVQGREKKLYTAGQFIWLLVVDFCGPTALLLLGTFSTSIWRSRKLPVFTRVSVSLVMAACFATAAAFGGMDSAHGFGGREILRCGILGCVNQATAASPAYATGTQPVIGLCVFITGFVGCAAHLLFVARTLFHEYQRSRYSSSVPRSSPLLFEDTLEQGPGKLSSPLLFEDALQQGLGTVDGIGCKCVHSAVLAAKHSPQQWLLVSGYLLLWLPLLLVFAAMLPDSFDMFTADKISAFAAVQVSSNNTECASLGWGPSAIICPEYTDSSHRVILRSMSVRMSAHVQLKFFPDVLLFYAFLYTVALAGLAAQFFPLAHRCFHRRIFLPPLPQFGPAKGPPSVALWHCSVGSLLLLSVAGVYLGLFMNYWVNDHNWGEKPTKEIWARALGQVGNVLMGLLVLPVARNSVWTTMLGVPWEAMIGIHVWLGGGFMAVGVVHMLVWWWYWASGDIVASVFAPNGTLIGTAAQHVFQPLAAPMWFPNNGQSFDAAPNGSDNWTVPTITVTFICSSLVLFATARWSIRRRHFEVFYHAHLILAPALFVGVLWHAASAWYYVGGGLALWILDRIIRGAKGCTPVTLHGFDTMSGGALTRIQFSFVSGARGGCPFASAAGAAHPQTAKTWHRPGQYCFVNVPALSTLEWHPFSLSSAPQDAVSAFHIKAMGAAAKDTFTRRLMGLALRACGEPWPEVFIDGPYGTPPRLDLYDCVILLAGGIGITPLHSIFRSALLTADAVRPQRVRLLWAARDEGLFHAFDDTWRRLEAHPLTGASARLFLTRGQKSAKGDDTLLAQESAKVSGFDSLLRQGRPDLRQEVQGFLPKHGRTLVFACGPGKMVAQASDVALALGIDFHAETFEL